MRYFKCIENIGSLNCFTVGKIYETDEYGHCLKDDNGVKWELYTLDGIDIKQQGCSFKELQKCLWNEDFLNSLSSGKFNKNDLKEGDIVILRDGVRGVIFEGCFMSRRHAFGLKWFDDNLKYRNVINGDIMMVIRNGHTIWKRTEKSPTQLKLEELEKKQREIADEMEKLRKEL